MQITQIFLADPQAEPGSYLTACVESVRREFAGIPHVLYDQSMVEAFLTDHYPPQVLEAYRRLIPYAYRADLARYCIVNKVGGWYFDAGMRCATGIDLPASIDLFAFRDINRYTATAWACDNGAFFAKAGHPVLQRAIDQVVEHCRSNYYGVSPLCPTGPNLWGRVIAIEGASSTLAFGDSVELTATYPQANKALVMPDGRILAYKKPSAPGDLESLGARGTNNYLTLWQERRVYSPHLTVKPKGFS
jgi:hypothetical protein